MDAQILILLLRLATVGIGVMKEIEALIKRVNAGEEITDAEIDEGSKRVDEAVKAWKAAVKKKLEPTPDGP